MKKQILFIGLLFVYAMSNSQGIRIVNMNGENNKIPIPVDTLLFTVQYEATTINDVAHPDKTDKEMTILRVGKKLSKYFSYTTFVKDSILSADFAANASQQTINEHMSQINGGDISYEIYKNYPERKLTVLDRIVMDNFVAEESIPKINWTISTDTTTVSGYLCKKATAYFRGRDYEAWFTPEIPRGDGPWKLQGLPGLIMKAYDKQKEFQFVCVGIEKAKKTVTIDFTENSRKKVTREELNLLYKRYNADPSGFIASNNPNVMVTINDQAGNEIKKMSNPYNPIELK